MGSRHADKYEPESDRYGAVPQNVCMVVMHGSRPFQT